jgi:small-conductance mechanosensitive channel
MIHSSEHLIWALALGLAAMALTAVVRNQRIRSRLWLTVGGVTAFAGLHGWIWFALDTSSPSFSQSLVIENLVLALSFVNAVVALTLNPWFSNRTLERAPAIVQDAIVVSLFVVIAVYGVGEGAWITSTAVAALVGFGLQEQLANAFAGLAIQLEKPFRVGHWITVDGHEGRVAEVTWRATKIRTKAGNFVVLPNNMVSQAAISNYSEPAAPTRVQVDVGASYLVPPNEVVDAIQTAMRRVPRILTVPEPDVLFSEFGDSALIYHARFWIDDFGIDLLIKHDVRTAIYYEFHRRDIEIPWPITVEYKRLDVPKDTPEIRAGYQRALAAVSVLAPLPEEAHHALAQAARPRLFGEGEVIVREGEAGSSMFVVRDGRVSISVGPDGREVAVTEAGGYFGEMSLLTGDQRSATVTAKTDCFVLEIRAEDFGAWVRTRPDVVDLLAVAATDRRRELDGRRAEPGVSRTQPVTLAERMRRFFRIG